MGIFDNFKKGTDIKITPKVALALASITITLADGDAAEEEIQAIIRLIRGDNAAFNKAKQYYVDTDDYDKIIENVSNSLNEEQKLATIANLVDIAMADGVLVGNEEDLLNRFLLEFNLPKDKEKSIIDVIGVKNDLSIFESV